MFSKTRYHKKVFTKYVGLESFGGYQSRINKANIGKNRNEKEGRCFKMSKSGKN